MPFSAGAIYSTTEDLLRSEQGLFGGKVLNAASLAKMTTPFKDDYGCGVGIHTVKGHKVIDHGGGIEGFTTFLAFYPESKLTVVVLSNVGGPAPQEVTPKLAAMAQGEKVELPTEPDDPACQRPVERSDVGSREERGDGIEQDTGAICRDICVAAGFCFSGDAGEP